MAEQDKPKAKPGKAKDAPGKTAGAASGGARERRVDNLDIGITRPARPAEAAKNEAAQPDAKPGATAGAAAAADAPGAASDTTSSSLPASGSRRAGAGDSSARDDKPMTQSHSPAHAPQATRTAPGFWALFLGGVVAAVIGFAAAMLVAPQGWPFSDPADEAFRQETRAALEAQQAELANLKGEGAGRAAQADLDALAGRLSEMETRLTRTEETAAETQERLSTLAAQVEELEKRPVTEGASPEAVAAYERELARLQEAVEAQRAEIETIAKDAATMEENAAESARQTMARAAVTRILTAIDAGDSFTAALTSLQEAGVAAPPALASAAETGVPTRAALLDAYPEAARDALATARQNEAPADAGALEKATSFLLGQVQARSVTPREGDDTDAILSRAEAALREGRLAEAVAELETLPPEVRAEMTDWLAQASERLEAKRAAEDLASKLNSQ